MSQESFCSICIKSIDQEKTFFELKCGHIFHLSCIIEWIKKQNTCPNCRIPIDSSKKQTVFTITGKKWSFWLKERLSALVTTDQFTTSSYFTKNGIVFKLNESTCLGIYSGNGPTDSNRFYYVNKEGIYYIPLDYITQKKNDLLETIDIDFTKFWIYPNLKCIVHDDTIVVNKI